MSESTTTVHDWLSSFILGETRKIPDNCKFHSLAYEAQTRFGFIMVRDRVKFIKRVCPECRR